MIYVASRVKHACRWQTYRQDGARINSSWIDEAGDGETADFGELWERIVREINAANALMLFAMADDFPLKGALVEVGIAIQCGKPIYLCIPGVVVEGRTSRPLGSWINHPLVTRISDPNDAFQSDTRLSPASPSADHLDSSLCGESSAGTGRQSTSDTAGGK